LYVTFGSLVGARSDARELFSTVLEAVSGLDADVLLTVGHAFDLLALEPIPANVRVAPWVPQDEILVHCNAVICHGGSGTTFGALAYGVPLGFIPLFADQPANARAVVGVGAGLVLEATTPGEAGLRPIDRSHAPAIRAMAEDLLRKRSYREAARHLVDEMAAQPDVSQMVSSLIDWAAAAAT
jgi:UDP:flavonoid glycosyltransferase YjiC (YdhE family)